MVPVTINLLMGREDPPAEAERPPPTIKRPQFQDKRNIRVYLLHQSLILPNRSLIFGCKIGASCKGASIVGPLQNVPKIRRVLHLWGKIFHKFQLAEQYCFSRVWFGNFIVNSGFCEFPGMCAGVLCSYDMWTNLQETWNWPHNWKGKKVKQKIP